jgi:hypothetical protein
VVSGYFLYLIHESLFTALQKTRVLSDIIKVNCNSHKYCVLTKTKILNVQYINHVNLNSQTESILPTIHVAGKLESGNLRVLAESFDVRGWVQK